MPATRDRILVASAKGPQDHLLNALLSECRGMTIEWAASVHQAMQKLAAQPYGACLVDQDMGISDGLEVVQKAARQGIKVPLVLLVGHRDPALEEAAVEAGAEDVLVASTASAEAVAHLLGSLVRRADVQSRLTSSEDRFAKVFAASPIAMSVSTLEDGKFVDVNPAFCKLMGYTKEEIIGKTSKELPFWFSERARSVARERLRQSGGYQGMEMLLQDRNGKLLHVLTTAQKVDIGGTDFIVALSQDITGQRRAEEEIRRREWQLERAESLSGSGSWELDIATGAMYWSPNLVRMLGLKGADRSLETFLSIIHEDDREKVREAIARASAIGPEVFVRLRMQSASGWTQMAITGDSEPDVQGQTTTVVGVLQPARAREDGARKEAAVSATRKSA